MPMCVRKFNQVAFLTPTTTQGKGTLTETVKRELVVMQHRAGRVGC